MYIKELKMSNYRSVPEEPIRFTPEMNFVIGENNTGKTSVNVNRKRGHGTAVGILDQI